MHDFYIYNTSSQKKEKLKPVKKGEVGVYACGPTVYNNQHIGNFRTFTFTDILVRSLKFLDYDVNYIMNITDVGHLTDDGDQGEDKIEKSARKMKMSAQEVANKFTKRFLKDWKKLNLIEPNERPKATEHIEEQIELIKELEDKGFTYKIKDDGIYFDTSKDKDYAKIFDADLEGMKEGARVEENEEKKNSHDFALWKFSSSAEGKRLQEWESPWGVGFPGWHLECSAMSKKYLGQPFDIHVGGEDHIFPHHPNEEAQSRCAYDEDLANYWMHVRHLSLKSGKMAKSKGRVYTLDDVENRGYSPSALRYYYLTAHYRTPAAFTWDSLDACQVGLNNLTSTLRNWKAEAEDVNVPRKLEDRFKGALADDLNIPKALAIVWSLTKSTDYPVAERKAAILKWDKEVLGLNLEKYVGEDDTTRSYIPKKVRALVEKRENYRKDKNFEKADEIRQKIEDEGFEVEDTSKGPVVKEV